jgi:predicted nuclease of predicted toxin-antitoxin system
LQQTGKSACWARPELKLLLDQNLSFRLLQRIRHLFPGSTHVTAVGLGGKSDNDIWQFAQMNEFCIASKDVDFNNLSILNGAPPKVIYLKCGNAETSILVKMLLQQIERIKAFEESIDAALLVIEKN